MEDVSEDDLARVRDVAEQFHYGADLHGARVALVIREGTADDAALQARFAWRCALNAEALRRVVDDLIALRAQLAQQEAREQALRDAMFVTRNAVSDLSRGFAHSVDPARWVEQLVAHIEDAVNKSIQPCRSTPASPTSI